MWCIFEKMNEILREIRLLREDAKQLRALVIREHQETRELIKQLHDTQNQGQQQPQQP